MKQKNILDRITIICLISGLVSGILTMALVWFVFPSAWFFFIIPAVMGWSIDKFAKIPKDVFSNEENIAKLQKQAGWTCAGFVLFFVLLANLPIFLVLEPIQHLLNILFYIICGVSVYWGYTRGVRCITDAYYDSVE